MKIGVTLGTYDLESGRTFSLDEVAEQAVRAEALGYDSAWVMDHHWLTFGDRRVGAHDPLITLGYLAARTRSLTLGVLVLGNSFRAVDQLARETAALADALPGRFVLGLGCGAQPLEHEAFDLPYERRVSRLETTLEALRPLLRAERVTLDRPPHLRLRDASTLVTETPPPIWIAGTGPRMLRLTARHADGWNGAWYGPDTSRFEQQLARVRQALREAGRGPDDLTISAGFLAIPEGGQPLAREEARIERLQPPGADASWPLPVRDRMLTGDAPALAAGLRRYRDLGVDHAILNFAPRPFIAAPPEFLAHGAEAIALAR